MTEPAGSNIVRLDEWPGGLRCGHCEHLMKEGDRYAEIPDGFFGDTPILMVVCESCGLASRPDAAVG